MDPDLQQFFMRTNHGRTIVALESGGWMALELNGGGRSDRVSLADILLSEDSRATRGSSITLLDQKRGGSLPCIGSISASALARDGSGKLILGFSDETGTHLYASIGSEISGVADISSNDDWEKLTASPLVGTVLGDLVVDPDEGNIVPLLCVGAGDVDDRIEIALPIEGAERHPIYAGPSLFPPTAHLELGGMLHLAWSDTCQRLRYLRVTLDDLRDGAIPEPTRVCDWGRHPVILPLGDGRVLIGFEPEFSHSINYAIVDGNGARVFGDDDRCLTESETDSRFSRENFHSPHLALDTFGIPWLFFVSIYRNHVFAARWLGRDWGPITAAGGIAHRTPHRDKRWLSIGRISVAKEAQWGATGPLVIHLQAEDPVREKSIELISPCIPSCRPDHKILFLDLQELAKFEGLVVVPQTAVKHPANPLLEPGAASAFDARRVFSGGTVRREGDKYRCWYSAMGEPDPSVGWWHWYRTGYAESKDGVLWSKPDLGMRPHPDMNEIPDMPPVTYVSRDEGDPDPEQRYKILYMLHHSRMRELVLKGELDPTDEKYFGALYTSSDGLSWNSRPAQMECPGGRHVEFLPQSLFHDEAEPDPARRYKAYGWMSMTQGQRGVAGAYSPDAIHWTAFEDNPVLAPELRGHPYVASGPWSHIHDGVVFRYDEYYLALYQYLHAPLAFDLEMAVSRDGHSFQFVNPGHKVIGMGEPGSWDSGMIFPSTPVVSDDEIRIYYGAANNPDESNAPPEVTGEDRCRYAMGLATLRRDGFSCAQFAGEETSGVLETLPFIPEGKNVELALNADCRDGRIDVELVDEGTGKPLTGFEYDSCEPMETDQIHRVVRWGGRPFPANHGGPLRVRIRLQGRDRSPSLYSLGFFR